MIRLWIRIWNLSQVLELFLERVLRVVILSFLVGILIGPFTLGSYWVSFLAPLTRSAQTFSRALRLQELRVILILKILVSSSGCFPSL